jgi:hypothetical protein
MRVNVKGQGTAFCVVDLNAKNTQRMQAAIEKAGYFREPIDNGGRSFKPRYGPAQEVEMVNSDYVHAKGYLNALREGKEKNTARC